MGVHHLRVVPFDERGQPGCHREVEAALHGQEGNWEASGLATFPPALIRSCQEEQMMATTLQGERQMKGLLRPPPTRAMPVDLDDAHWCEVRRHIPSGTRV
jgi:hypothetical protein